uniref:Large proline-rich protein bag6-like isoform X3 n=1 Tax=Rhizophora mucronata TaxID=61149 RepID=A0A2P2KVN2_RHIMU
MFENPMFLFLFQSLFQTLQLHQQQKLYQYHGFPFSSD